MGEIAFRQVHLDFHTSPLIPDVGSAFDAEQFAGTLKSAHVNSVTVFAKCHHGMSYYPTAVGVAHPSLTRDLLGEMISACHAAGIRTPVYISVVWDELMAHEHPEWLQVTPEGRTGVIAPFTAGWKWLCMNSPYLEYVIEQTREVVSRYDADGIFFDIIMMTEPGCTCRYCMDGMRAQGLDPENEQHLRHYAVDVARRAMDRLSRSVWDARPGLPVFFNSRLRLARDRESGWRSELPFMTHVEIESLPTGQWGYLHYPLYARYVQTLGTGYLGMTARFHKSWADFGGLKNQAALEYEVVAMLATGARCSIGDQLHPRGALEQPAYDLIERVYRSVEAKEPWCSGAEPVQEVGVLLTVEGWDRAADVTPEEGATRALLESQWQFQLVDSVADWSAYKALVLPDRVPVDREMAERLRAYVAQGGGLVVSGATALEGNDGVLADLLGVRPGEPSDYTTHYIQAEPSLGLPDMAHVMYEPPVLVSADEGTEVLARIVEPFFERRWDHFSSHRQTAPARVTEHPAVTRKGRGFFVASPIFCGYRLHGSLAYRQIVDACLRRLIPERAIWSGLPSGGQVTLFRKGTDLVAHLLYYVPERRTPDTDIIEDTVPMHDVPLWVRTGALPKHAYLAPEGKRLNWQYRAGVATVMVPELRGHQMVVLEMA
jgi:hypothetical protein